MSLECWFIQRDDGIQVIYKRFQQRCPMQKVTKGGPVSAIKILEKWISHVYVQKHFTHYNILLKETSNFSSWAEGFWEIVRFSWNEIKNSLVIYISDGKSPLIPIYKFINHNCLSAKFIHHIAGYHMGFTKTKSQQPLRNA